MSPLPVALISLKMGETDMFIPRKMLTAKAALRRMSHSRRLGHGRTLKALLRRTPSIAQALENRLPGSPWTFRERGDSLLSVGQ